MLPEGEHGKSPGSHGTRRRPGGGTRSDGDRRGRPTTGGRSRPGDAQRGDRARRRRPVRRPRARCPACGSRSGPRARPSRTSTRPSRCAVRRKPRCSPGSSPTTTACSGTSRPTAGSSGFDDRSTIATWLTPTYRTGLIGKYLNGYSPPYKPPGWDEWMVPASMYGYTGSRWYLNRGAGGSYQTITGYQTDTMAGLASEFISRNAPRAEPFFLYVSLVAPQNGTPRDPDDVAGFPSPYVKPVYRDRFANLTNTVLVQRGRRLRQAAAPPGAAVGDRDPRDHRAPAAASRGEPLRGRRRRPDRAVTLGLGRAGRHLPGLHLRQRDDPGRAPDPWRQADAVRGLQPRPVHGARAGHPRRRP